MKTPQSPPNSSLYRAAQAAVVLTGFVLSPAAFSQTTAAISSGPKDHVLFVGTDLAVKEGSEFFHVVGAKKDSLQIEKGHHLADVRLGQGANIRVSRGVKLSSLSATISNVQTESIDRASSRAQLAAMQAAMLLTDEAGDQEDRLHGKMTLLSASAVTPYRTASDGSLIPLTGADISRANLDASQAAAASSYTGALPALDRAATSASTFLSQTLTQAPPIDDEVTFDASALSGLKLLGGSAPSGSGLSDSASSSFAQKNLPSGTT